MCNNHQSYYHWLYIHINSKGCCITVAVTCGFKRVQTRLEHHCCADIFLFSLKLPPSSLHY